ncbi:hypothetical protein [Clostridium beijerinckii]|jgi:hypothetical protein|uniref:hypothetical protein n=1 Tax=Clostridium beijerinckii TaxID=1520 RepID=UPI001361F1C0|nr:hypothetical protein [Clostridium beijerinckii]MZK53673.1 hypothetical protein [Clostridium beijerinckii]MZK61802.1 hypothetical protein [Clostridium beijerinckii]MZK71983.1 hypothetical protein [Clostridium beijerinckii]MZK77376.1 hypothetical protein [Clostridium beijerinckii]MZK86954.1 hypothetical protein [Clostridium beijerinckii]
MSKLSSKKIIKVINKAIALNPTEITFTQVSKNEVDGAWEEVVNEKTITVLIYLGSSETSNSVESKTEGTLYVNNKYKMVADKDADLEVNPKESIKFESNGEKFEIKAVYPQKVENTICGYICDLERIN